MPTQIKNPAAMGLTGPSTMAERIYERLREMILRAEIAPGEKLLPTQLAQMFGVSPTPIREALRLLEQANLVEITPHRGAIVRSSLSAKQVDELYTVRLGLEQLAIRIISSAPPQDGWDHLQQAVEKYRRGVAKDDFEQALLWDMRFHSLIVQAASNRILEEMFGRLENQIQILRRLDRGLTRRQQSLQDHEIIMQALKRGNYAAAQAALEKHILIGREHVLEVLSKLEKS